MMNHTQPGLPVNQGSQSPMLELADIHLPGQPDAWPPAPGWWILLFLILALSVWIVLKYLHYRKLKRQRQRIMQALHQLEKELRAGKAQDAITEMNILLRRLALMHYPRKQIASLTGKEWLAFLDSSGKTQDFSEGAGRILADVPYLPAMPETIDVKGLTKAVKNWVRQVAVKNIDNKGVTR